MSVFLEEAKRIGEALLSKLQADETGQYWESLGYKVDFYGEGTYSWRKSATIYDGNAGIVLFFIQLYKNTHDPRYLALIHRVSNWLFHQLSALSESYAFVSGRLGLSYTFMQVYLLTKEAQYLEMAEKAAEGCESYLHKGWDDWLLGISGSLIPLMHLHMLTGKEKYLKLIEQFANRLLQKSSLGPKAGLYWDRSPDQVRGLCGYSHGASGVGEVWLELGNYTGNPAFFYLAEEAFRYEDEYYNPEQKNWPDFRKSNERQKEQEANLAALEAGNEAYFNESEFMQAWCHGSPGIGLARLRAFMLLKTPTYLAQVRDCLPEKVNLDLLEKESEDPLLILCHGICGNADLKIEFARQTREDTLLAEVKKLGKWIIRRRAEGMSYRSGFALSPEEDTSLFMGSAGIGYFFLRLHNPDTPSVLLISGPDNEKRGGLIAADSFLRSTPASILKRLLAKKYKRTMALLSSRGESLQDWVPFDTKTPARHLAEQAFLDHLASLTEESNLPLQDIFALERKMAEWEERDMSAFYLTTRTMQESRKNQAILAGEQANFQEKRIQQNPYAIRHTCRYNWAHYLGGEGLPEKGEFPFLLVRTPMGVIELVLSEVVAALMDTAVHPIVYQDLLQGACQWFDPETETERKAVEARIHTKIQELIHHQFLNFV